MVIQVGFPVHVSLEPVNNGLVAVAGLLEDSGALQERQGVAYCIGVAVEPQEPVSRHSGSSQEGQCAEERYGDPLLLRMLGSELLQDLFIGHEQCDADGVGVVGTLEATDA